MPLPIVPILIGGGLLFGGGAVTGAVAMTKVEKLAGYGALMGAAYLIYTKVK